MKEILVKLPDNVVQVIDKELVGKLGESQSDTLGTIIMNWLGEQGYLAKGRTAKEHLPENEPSYSR